MILDKLTVSNYLFISEMKILVLLWRVPLGIMILYTRMRSTGEGSGKPLQYSCLENPMNSMKRQKDRTLKDELPRLVGAQYDTGDQWRNNFRKNEGMVHEMVGWHHPRNGHEFG